MSSFVLWPTLLIPMAFGVGILLCKPKNAGKAACAGCLLTCLAAVVTGLYGGQTKFVITEAVSVILELDRLGGFFIAIITAAFFAAVVYACEYFAHDKGAYRFFGFCLLTLGAMTGLSMAGNMITFYMFYELMSLMSFPLVLYNGGQTASSAAMKYLGFSVFGASLALMGMMLGGGLTLSHFGSAVPTGALSQKHLWACLLMLLGFSCKAGMLPLSNWLPTAHPVAPAPASALLSGIITKAGILGIIRSAFYIFGAGNIAGTFVQAVMLWLSIATIFTGSMLAYKEHMLKKRLAYSSVSQLSYVIFGIMLCTPLGLQGALLQVVFHACAKVGLFLCAGAFIHNWDANYVEQLEGMAHRSPKIMAAFTAFSLSLIGIPPFGGFIAKWQIASGAFTQGSIAANVGVVVLMISALLTAGYLLPIVSRAYFPGHGYKAKVRDGGVKMTAPLFAMTAATALLGVFPQGLSAFIGKISAALF